MNNELWSHLKVWLAYLKPHKKELTSGIVMQVVSTISVLIIPSLVGYVSVAIISPERTNSFNIKEVFLIVILLLFIRALFQFLGSSLLGTVHEKVIVDLQANVYNHTQRLPLTWFNDRKHGDLMAIINRDTSHLAGFIAGSLPALIPTIFLFLAVMIMMMTIDLLLGFLVVLLLPIFYLISKLIGKQLRKSSDKLVKSYGKAVAIADENLNRIADIKAFNRESYETGRFREMMNEVLSQSISVVRLNSALGPAIQFMAASGIVALIWLTGGQVAVGAITPAQQVSFLLYGLLLAQPVSMLASIYGRMQLALAAAKRLEEITQQTIESDQGVELTSEDVTGGLTFNKVSFSYPQREPLIKELDLTIKKGETIAITGKNGAGKSTLIHLLLRFYEPDSGTIYLDETDIQQLSIHSLRGQIGLVSQNITLINGSIKENIGYGKETATDLEIESACQLAGLDRFINQLPQQIETQIGDHGTKLSGGQKQRLALARCLLKGAKIIILDEATAMFDPKGETDFIKKAAQSLKDKTVIIITHRKASLELADHIYELKAGKINLVDKR